MARMTVIEMKRVMHSMAMLLLHQGDKIALSPEAVSSHFDVVQSALAGVTTEVSSG